MVKHEDFYDNHKKTQQTEATDRSEAPIKKNRSKNDGCEYVYPPKEPKNLSAINNSDIDISGLDKFQNDSQQNSVKKAKKKPRKHTKNIAYLKKEKNPKPQIQNNNQNILYKEKNQEQEKQQEQQQQQQQELDQEQDQDYNLQNKNLQNQCNDVERQNTKDSLPVRMIYQPNQVQIQLSDELFEFAQLLVHYKKLCKCLFYTLIIFSLATVVNYILIVEDEGKSKFQTGEILAIIDYLIWATGTFVASKGVEYGREKLVKNSNYLFVLSLFTYFGASIYRCWYYYGIKKGLQGYLWGVFLSFFMIYFFYVRACNLIPKTYRVAKKMRSYKKNKSKQDPNISFLVQFEV